MQILVQRVDVQTELRDEFLPDRLKFRVDLAYEVCGERGKAFVDCETGRRGRLRIGCRCNRRFQVCHG
jgi:hypothetical protein